MSYRRSYTGYVRYSGSVSYPASQNGGSVSYSGTEPVYITIDVDTDVFDASISHCNNAVNGLTTAVVATEAAQVESKRKTSMQIAAAIVKGFFEYVGADLSQKIKELASKCESLFFALMGHKENCLSKSKQMQEDYNRISKRYSKVFEDLDKETISRIEILDKPTFHFANVAQTVVNRSSSTELLGISTISANESLKLETILSCSHVKQQANTLIAKANDYLQGTYRLNNSVRDMLYDVSEGRDILIPILFVESVANSDNKETKIIASDRKHMKLNDSMNSQLRSKFMSKEIEWDNISSVDFEKIISYLNTDVQSEQMENRTLKTMLELLNEQKIQTIKA